MFHGSSHNAGTGFESKTLGEEAGASLELSKVRSEEVSLTVAYARKNQSSTVHAVQLTFRLKVWVGMSWSRLNEACRTALIAVCVGKEFALR